MGIGEAFEFEKTGQILPENHRRKTYRVYQDNKPADTDGYPALHESWSPELNTHSNLEEAIRYANAYAYPFDVDMLDSLMKDKRYMPMEVGAPIDMGMGNPVMMEIREIASNPKDLPNGQD